MRFITGFLASLMFIPFMVSPCRAEVVWCTNCSDKFTQAIEKVTNIEQLKQLVLEYKESVMQTMQQVQMVQQNIEQYANMVKNTIALPFEIYGEVKGTFTRLASLTSQLRTSRGDIQALGGVFRSVYRETEGMGDLAVSSLDKIQSTINGWGKGVDNAAESLFQLSGAQLDTMVKDTPALERHIDALLSTPSGQMQALMAGNTLTSMQLQESRQLRELMATFSQSQLAIQMKAEKREQLSQEQWKKATETTLIDELLRYECSDPF